MCGFHCRREHETTITPASDSSGCEFFNYSTLPSGRSADEQMQYSCAQPQNCAMISSAERAGRAENAQYTDSPTISRSTVIFNLRQNEQNIPFSTFDLIGQQRQQEREKKKYRRYCSVPVHDDRKNKLLLNISILNEFDRLIILQIKIWQKKSSISHSHYYF